MGYRECGGLFCCTKGSQTRAGVITLKKETDKHINEHIKAQERGHKQEMGVRAKNERNEEKRKSTRKLITRGINSSSQNILNVG